MTHPLFLLVDLYFSFQRTTLPLPTSPPLTCVLFMSIYFSVSIRLSVNLFISTYVCLSYSPASPLIHLFSSSVYSPVFHILMSTCCPSPYNSLPCIPSCSVLPSVSISVTPHFIHIRYPSFTPYIPACLSFTPSSLTPFFSLPLPFFQSQSYFTHQDLSYF